MFIRTSWAEEYKPFAGWSTGKVYIKSVIRFAKGAEMPLGSRSYALPQSFCVHNLYLFFFIKEPDIFFIIL